MGWCVFKSYFLGYFLGSKYESILFKSVSHDKQLTQFEFYNLFVKYLNIYIFI